MNKFLGEFYPQIVKKKTNKYFFKKIGETNKQKSTQYGNNSSSNKPKQNKIKIK